MAVSEADANALWLTTQDGTIIYYEVLLPRASSHSSTPPTVALTQHRRKPMARG